MIRSFMPLDVVDLLVAGRALSNKAKTRDSVGRKDARFGDLANIVGDWFNPQLRPCVWVYADGLALRGLASVRDRHSSHAWEINRLLVADQDRNCCLKLLEHVSSAGGQHGDREDLPAPSRGEPPPEGSARDRFLALFY